MRRFAALTDSMNVDTVLGVATSACREANNGGAFLAAVEEETGIRIRLISGHDEGRMIQAAVRRAIDVGSRNNLIVDIGGGSIELVYSEGPDPQRVESVNLGVQRLLDTVGHSGPLSKKERKRLAHLVDAQLGAFLSHVAGSGHASSLVIGTSGTIEALGEASRKLSGHARWRTVNAQVVQAKELTELRDALCEMSEADRESKLGIPDRRADSIHMGAVVLSRILELAGASQLTLCDASLRDGVVAAELERRRRGGTSQPLEPMSVRDRAVYQLARRCGVTLYSAERVARLATMLFDGLKPLHELREPERQILTDASILYDIGRFIHRKRRHKHGRYLIAHSRLRGFTQEEIDVLSLVVRYHRRGLPKKKHKRFRRLSKRDRRVVSMLGGILRVAIALDRKHTGAVERVEIASGGGEVVILCHGRDPSVEVWAARHSVALLERVLDAMVVVRQFGEV
jgi:exopolyphosphatase/guanosine-5'-triphosphate,3'-diphosphate pyrophosphatase